jgi:DNA mismatch endonuclease (patch repair protein)
VDNLNRRSRSRLMSRVRSSGAKSTELKFRLLLVRAGVCGWKLGHRLGLPGRPDFVFVKRRLAIFVDGCFWHACSRCRATPKSNRVFWNRKLQGNVKRDLKARKMLRAMGWAVVRIWEHELREDGVRVLRRVLLQRSSSKPTVSTKRHRSTLGSCRSGALQSGAGSASYI